MAQKLSALRREEYGSRPARRIRQDGRLPAVLYKEGKHGDNLTVAERDFRRLLTSGEQIVTLEIDGTERRALLKEVQYDALGEHIMHVDFNELRVGQKVRVDVSVVAKGTPKGVAGGGVMTLLLHEVAVECLPESIPEKLEVLVDELEVGHTITVGQLKLPDNVKVLRPAEDPVVTMTARHEEEIAPPVGEAATALEPEVLTERKPTEEDAADESKSKDKGDKSKE
jgi:large subunit ribosomal protein L25